MTDDPTPEKLRALRKAASLTQEQAAALVYAGRRTWIAWEHGEREIPRAEYELFTIKTYPWRK